MNMTKVVRWIRHRQYGYSVEFPIGKRRVWVFARTVPLIWERPFRRTSCGGFLTFSPLGYIEICVFRRKA